MINHVLQEDPNGCGLACLAMITGQTYKQVEAEVTYREHGITDWAVQAYLADKGYSTAWKHRYTMYDNQQRREWPPKLWANVHIVTVYKTAGAHFIVVFRNGTVLDPAIPGERKLTDYSHIESVGAIYRGGEIDVRTDGQIQQDIDNNFFDEEYR